MNERAAWLKEKKKNKRKIGKNNQNGFVSQSVNLSPTQIETSICIISTN